MIPSIESFCHSLSKPQYDELCDIIDKYNQQIEQLVACRTILQAENELLKRNFEIKNKFCDKITSKYYKLTKKCNWLSSKNDELNVIDITHRKTISQMENTILELKREFKKLDHISCHSPSQDSTTKTTQMDFNSPSFYPSSSPLSMTSYVDDSHSSPLSFGDKQHVPFFRNETLIEPYKCNLSKFDVLPQNWNPSHKLYYNIGVKDIEPHKLPYPELYNKC